jgi:hypothetical protein
MFSFIFYILRGCTGFCTGIGLLGLTLQELKLNMKDGKGTFVARTFGVGSKQILKSALFWSTCAIYFFYQWGNSFILSYYLFEAITMFNVVNKYKAH